VEAMAVTAPTDAVTQRQHWADDDEDVNFDGDGFS